ncbi:MAG: hypothetical protein CME61_03030 [Halobacteriovoraceae bacterium]|nr:hypothetical protein [Halobacteriovoraceae bacterium]|tara:strand:- start:1464 stop:3101 length:1638 start_codon:yes stop_codon:yes gene_type:complete
MIRKLILFFFLTHSFVSAASIKRYEKVHNKFRKKLCAPGVTRKYYSLLSKTNKSGHYIPVVEGKLNSFVIKKNLVTLRKKRKWLADNIENISSKTNLSLKKEVINLSTKLDELLVIKKEFYTRGKEKKEFKKKSKDLFLSFKKDLLNFLEKLKILHTYNFPVNHLAMRSQYDLLKIRKDIPGQTLSQDVFFKRKVIEDGAPHPRWRGSDLAIRSLINTIYFEIKNNTDVILPENLRYDLSWLLSKINDYLRFDSSIIKRKNKRWLNKIDAQIKFYNSLLSNNLKMNGQKISVDDLIKNNLDAKDRLKKWIYEKQADTYEFWMKQDVKMRQMYVADTIILNEVGGTPDPLDVEKREVLKVVFKRKGLSFYSTLGKDDDLNLVLEKRGINTQGQAWLNTLFKKGEFSFTYYFIPGVRHIFCPDMSRKAKSIRRVALDISNNLNQEDLDFVGIPVRYFSRQSMLGRIDMSKLWKAFLPIPEKAGPKIKDASTLDIITKGDHKFLYEFRNDENNYQVFQVGQDTFVKGKGPQAYFYYRNPNYFKYFIEK